MAKARQQYFADEVTLQKENRDFAIQPELVEKLESIEAGAQVNVIETVKVNGEALTPDENKAVDVSVPLVEDTLYSTDPDKALSANQGKVLYEYIQNLASRGRYLSNWNTVTGLPTTNPVDNPYQYRAGDYYVVSNVAAEGGTNYRPNGTTYSWGVASTTVETETVRVGDYYTYDGEHWLLLVNTSREIAVDSSLSTTSTNPVENRVITNALNTKQNNISDLETIRSGAALGATALHPGASLSELTGTSDNITQGTTNLFMTTAERSKLSNQSGVNTGDETQTTIKNKLGQASTSTDGYLTSTDWNTFNNKQGTISDLETIRSNASAGKNASDTIATYGDIVTHDADEFATAAQGAKADTALQSGDNVSELTNDAGYITDAYHDDTKQDKLIAGANIQIAADGKTISATDTTYVAGDFDIKDLADNTGLRAEWSGKQDELIAGTNIQIAADGKTISATDTKYTAGVNVSISNNNVISATDSKAEWGNISGTLSDQTDLNTALGGKQDTLIAGANIQIASDGKTISATDTTYTAGAGIDITNGVISNTQTSAEWGNITGTLSDQTDLQSALDAKQDDLIAGANIQIAVDGKTISATDTKYTASDFDIKDLADSTGKRASWDAKQNAISDLATIRSNASTAIQPNDNVSMLTNDAGYITSADIPTLDTAMSSTSTNAVQNNVIKDYVDTQVQEATSGAVSDTAYGSSWDGITGIAPSKNAVYDKISAMDTTIAGKQDTISDLSTIRSGAALGATALQSGDNISELNNDAGFITKAVSDLTNYYTKSETYTKAEVADYVANFAGFKVVATLPTTDIKTTIIYLLGPVGTGADKYEEYIYSNNAWVKIGETSVDLTNYFNTSTDTSDDITEGSTNLFLTSAERTKLANTSGVNTGDETKTTIQSKLGAATSSNDGYLTSADWTTFNNKQATISDLAAIRSGAAAGATAVQPNDNISELTNDAGYITSASLPIVNNGTLTVKQNGTSKGTFTANQSGASTIELTDTTYSAGSGISIANNAISTASIYGTSSTAAATAEKVVSIPSITSLNVGQVIIVHPTITSTVADSTIKLNNFDAYPMRYNNAAITTSSDSIVWHANYLSMFMFDGTYWQFLGHGLDSNATYSHMSATEANTGTATSARTISASVLKGAIETHAPVSSVNGQTGDVTIASPDLSNYLAKDNTTAFTPTGDYNPATKKYVDDSVVEYNAGEGIEIGDVTINGRKGPSPDGFHVPSITELEGLKTIMDGLSLTTGDNWRINLHMPFAGNLNSSASIYKQGSLGRYWSSSSAATLSYYLSLNSSSVGTIYSQRRNFGLSVRCFKDSYESPDSAWTIVQGTLGSAGIFWNQSQGLISITDGSTGYTMMDKNLGATTVYNDGDTLTQANMGNMYQWGNNYGFPSTGTISKTSSTQVDASAYGPTNPYSSDTFITGSQDWSSVQNDDLWGDTTGTITQENVISNTGVLSVNGQTGNVIISSGDVLVSDQANNIFTPGMKIWGGTESDFNNLTPDSNTAYLLLAGGPTPGGLPAEYQEVEWIGTSGTQYIDTLFSATGNTEFEFVFTPTDVTGYQGYFGADYDWNSTAFSLYNARMFSFGNQYQSEGSYFTADTKYTLEFKNLTFYKDSTSIYSVNSETFTTPHTVLLGACYRESYSGISNYGQEKIHSFKLRDGGTEVRDFVPCYRKLDSVVGMYDLVGGQFYINSGTGTFSVGPDAN